MEIESRDMPSVSPVGVGQRSFWFGPIFILPRNFNFYSVDTDIGYFFLDSIISVNNHYIMFYSGVILQAALLLESCCL